MIHINHWPKQHDIVSHIIAPKRNDKYRLVDLIFHKKFHLNVELLEKSKKRKF